MEVGDTVHKETHKKTSKFTAKAVERSGEGVIFY